MEKILTRKYNLISILYTLGLSTWSGTIYIYMEREGYNFSNINFYLSIFWIITFFAEIPSGIIADYMGARISIILSCLLRALGLLILVFPSHTLIILILSGILTGISDSMYSGTLSSWIVKQLKKINSKTDMGIIFSRNSTLGNIGALLAGVLAAQVLGNINLSYPLIAGSVLLIITIPFAFFMIDSEELVSGNFIKNLTTEYKNFFHFKSSNMNMQPLRYMISFLPILLIVTGPYNQWQLFFQKNNMSIKTGFILIGVNLGGVIGSYLIKYFLMIKLKRISQLMLLVTFNAISVFLTTMIPLYVISVLFFWLHVIIVTMDEIIRGTALHEVIQSTNRTTIISINNTLEAGATVIVLSLNGYLSDKFGIANTWNVLAILGWLLTILGYVWLNKKK